MDNNKIDKEVILNVASGTIEPLDLNPNKFSFIVNSDLIYYNSSSPESIEQRFEKWVNRDILYANPYNVYTSTNAFEFMSRTIIKFDRVCAYRFLEHVKRQDILFFIYLISKVLKRGGIVDIIVPDYEVLAKRILNEDVNSSDFEKEDIITSTEVLNEKEDPHLSIWTIPRLKKYFTLENRFEIGDIEPNFSFDGRNIYIRFLARRL